MLRIKDPEKSLRFYNDCFGLHVVFIFNVGPWTIYYLGPRDVGIANLGTSKGLLELYHIPSDANMTYTSGNDYANNPGGMGFGHVGFTVPDVAEALERVKSFGFEVIKPLDEAAEAQMGVNGAVVSGEAGVVDEGYKHVFRQLAFVKDPDVSDSFPQSLIELYRKVGNRYIGVKRKYSVLMCVIGLLGRARTTGCKTAWRSLRLGLWSQRFRNKNENKILKTVTLAMQNSRVKHQQLSSFSSVAQATARIMSRLMLTP